MMRAIYNEVSTPVLWVVMLAGLVLAGCEGSGGGYSSHTTVYHGYGYYDPWYWDDGDIHIHPPDNIGPPGNRGLRPSHPIASPPRARPMPMPRPVRRR